MSNLSKTPFDFSNFFIKDKEDEYEEFNEYDEDIDLPFDSNLNNKNIELIEELESYSSLPFKLDYYQLNVVFKIIDFFTKSKENVMLLTGGPGTSKSTIISQVINYLYNNNYDVLACAPTHKARINLSNMLKNTIEVITLHQLLKLKPNIEIPLLNFRDLQMECHLNDYNTRIPRYLIIDECSMVTSDLYKYIKEELITKRKVKILFLGDVKQLKGVNEVSESEVFQIKNRIELTKIYRQKEDAPLLYLLQDIKDKPIQGKLKDFKSASGNLHNCETAKEFIILAARKYKEAIEKKNPNLTKILTYTNKRIDEYNNILHKILYKNSSLEYGVGEIVTGYDNFNPGNQGEGIINSVDYVITEVEGYIKPKSDIFPFDLRGYLITLDTKWWEDSSDKSDIFRYITIFIMSTILDPIGIERYTKYLEYYRLQAIQQKKGTRLYSKYWRNYFKLNDYAASPINLFYDNRLIKSATLKLGYACSIHKAQGSSINDVFIDLGDVKKCYDQEELRQLEYVALSRAKNDVFILN